MNNEISEINIVSVIINSISTLISNLFSSIDNTLYEYLDDLLFINTDIISNSSFENLIGNNGSGIILICNTIILAICLYYGISLLLSYLTLSEMQKPSQFIFRLLFCVIALNFSYFICDRLIYIVSCISLAIRNVGEITLDVEICFSSLIQKLNSTIYVEETSLNIFSFNGLIKVFVSVGLINLTLSYALRYIMIKVFVLFSPFAFISLIVKNSTWLFKSWFKALFSLLFLQILVPLILLICFSLDLSNTDIFSKLTLVGSIYALIKANSYVKEFIGGISTDINLSVSGIKNLFNGGS